MEKQLRKLIQASRTPSLSADINHTIVHNDDVQFFWCMISADWEDASTHALLEMVVNQCMGKDSWFFICKCLGREI